MPAESRWMRFELEGPSGADPEDWAGECAAALVPIGCLGVEELPARAGRPFVVAWMPEGALRDDVAQALAASSVDARLEAGESVADQRWVEAFNLTLRPVDVGRRLTIIPGEGEPPPGRVALRIEPGRAFGTGHHESTRLALEWLEEVVPPARAILDVGTGTGILAAAAIALGAERAVALDIDPEAIEVATQNVGRTLGAKADRVRLAVTASPAGLGERFDVVIANIQVDVILGMLEALVACLNPDASLILSGLLRADEAAIERALAQRGMSLKWRREGEWISARAIAS